MCLENSESLPFDPTSPPPATVKLILSHSTLGSMGGWGEGKYIEAGRALDQRL